MNRVDLEFSLQKVPNSHRKGFFQILAVMLSLTFFSASMYSGGTLGLSMTFSDLVTVIIVGNLILGVYTGTLAFIASKTGFSTHILTRFSFGMSGSYISSFLLSATQIGWFGVGVAMFAVFVNKATGINLYLLIAIFGILMSASSIYGMKVLVILALIAIPLILILGSFSLFDAVNELGGVFELTNHIPIRQISMSAALSICIGSFISAGTLTPDFIRFAKSKKSAVICTVIAFFLGNSLMFGFGAIGAIATGYSDISEIMVLQGLIVPAIIVIGLNIWTTNDSALYASGLGISNILKLPKRKVVFFNGIIGTICSMWLYNNFISYLTILSSTLPSIGAIIIADFLILKRGNYTNLNRENFKNINFIAFVSWIIGVILANVLPGVAPINAVISTMLLYIVLDRAVSYLQIKKSFLEVSNAY